MGNGTITRREAKSVISDAMQQGGVPSSVWSITPGGELNMLIGNRRVVFQVSGKLSFYQLASLRKKVDEAVEEWRRRPDPRQTDLEAHIRKLEAAE